MPKYTESVPNGWKQMFRFGSVPKSGSPVEVSFDLFLSAPVSHWGLLYSFSEPLSALVSAYYSDGRVVMDVSLRGRGTVPCARCLEPAGLEINGKLRYLFSLCSRDDVEADRELSSEGKEQDDVIIVDSWEGEVDLAPMVWEVLITSLPPSAKCSENCKGLCPVCGANLNVEECGCRKREPDPRLEVLRSFKPEEES
jgi:uncharacterized protein